jgi:hypothetical protein
MNQVMDATTPWKKHQPLTEPRNTYDLLDTLAKVLARCVVMCVLLVLFWFGTYMLAREVIYAMHGRLFRLTRHELDVIHYCGMAWVKGCTLVFFLFPYIAIRRVLKKRPEAEA